MTQSKLVLQANLKVKYYDWNKKLEVLLLLVLVNAAQTHLPG